ncbi:MAG: L,D-transpeptidase family protein [Candidatus Eisenbacteria bacterium]
MERNSVLFYVIPKRWAAVCATTTAALCLLMVALLLCGPPEARAERLNNRDLYGQVRELLRNRIETGCTAPEFIVCGRDLYASIALPRFYEKRSYLPIWIDESGISPASRELLRALRGADAEGLRSSDYDLARIGTMLERFGDLSSNQGRANPRGLVDLELLLTDAFLIYGSHLVAGRVNPETFDPEWFANRRDVDMAEVLETAISSSAVQETLENLRPSQAGYVRLREALAAYRDIAQKGGWPVVPAGPKLEKGDSGSRITSLRERLRVTGDLREGEAVDREEFDDGLEAAVKHFQKRHGLDVDGIVGPATLSALNGSAEDRVRRIEINMERWRWLPQDLGPRYIIVNIANFELDVVEAEKEVLTMRVIVGRDYRRTPVFSGRMTYIVLNPYWHVPPSLAVKDILPQVRKNPGYLTEKGFKIFQGWGGDTKEIDPNSVDWPKVTAKDFKYRFRQEPGPVNALGRVKFMFPNKFDVYLHDTPSQDLFAKTARAFSSGCIRVEKPIELAEYVLRDDPKWNRDAVLAVIGRRVEQTVRLPESIPVHVLYWTAWVDAFGTVHFREDIYGRDKLLAEALAEKPPM